MKAQENLRLNLNFNDSIAEISLDNPQITSIEVATLNTVYLFTRVYTGEHEPCWRIIDGRKDIVGEQADLVGIDPDGRFADAIRTGGRLGIYLPERGEGVLFHTSTIFRLSAISRLRAAA